VKVHACQPEGCRNDDGSRGAIRAEGLAVQEHGRVETSGAPALQDCPQRGVVHAEERRHRRQVWREPDDRADIQVAVGPAVQPSADPAGERVVDGRMAECALKAGGREAVALEEPVTPTTASSLSRVSVFRGSFRLTAPRASAALNHLGSASTSTLSPTASAAA
jgi:hypothetical protein